MATRVTPALPDDDGRVPCTGVVVVPGDPLEREAWHRALLRVEGVSHPHLAPLRAVVVREGAFTLTHAVPAHWRPLDAALVDVPALAAGQVVTVGVPVAQALAALHEAGVTLGAITCDDIVVDRAGRPELVARRVRPMRRGDEAEDVVALATLLRELLADGAAPAALAMVLLRAVDPDDPMAASAAGFAAALLRAQRPSPLWTRPPAWVRGEASPAGAAAGPDLGGAGAEAAGAEAAGADDGRPAPDSADEDVDPVRALRKSAIDRGRAPTRTRREPRPPRATTVVLASSSRRSRRAARRASTAGRARLVGGVVLAAVLVAAAATGVAWAASDRDAAGSLAPAAPPLAPLTPAAVPPGPAVPESTGTARADWGQVLAALDRARVAALTAGEVAGLDRVDLPGSAAMRADVELLGRLRAAGVRPAGLGLTIDLVTPVRVTSGEVTLRVVDRRPAYALVDAAGEVVVRRPARSARAWAVTLARDATGEWRVLSVIAQDVIAAGRG